jgi:hypothetical protein
MYRRSVIRIELLALLVLVSIEARPVSAEISAAWVNDGADKVMQHELRAETGRVENALWDGTTVKLFAARNEIVGCNLVLEAKAGANGVAVELRELAGPGGARIASRAASGDEVFNYVGRNIELFYIRYLQVRGLSRLSYDVYDERHIPTKMRRPFTVAANNKTQSSAVWSDRPGADKFFPEIAVPLEFHSRFDIGAKTNQSIWIDIYVPRDAAAGTYTGSIAVRVGDNVVKTLPIRLEVLGFSLPDQPTAKSMIALEPYDLAHRFTGKRFPDAGTAEFAQAVAIRDQNFRLVRRHKLTLMGGEYPEESRDSIAPPSSAYVQKLRGTFFSEANGYDGPGKNTPLDLFVIGPYGSARWTRSDAATVHKRMDEWETYFRDNFPNVDRFIYDIDEPNVSDPKIAAELNNRLDVYKSNTGIGRSLPIFTTAYIDKAIASVPRFDIVGQWTSVGVTDVVQRAVDTHRARGGKIYQYNGIRPGSGSFATEDEGTSPRMIPWAQFKLGIDRHFYYALNYYNDYQTSGKQTNVFRSGRTYGVDDRFDPVLGRTGWNYSNGDGVLVYPGTDKLFPEDSYGRAGSFASLRLKHWRRGVQDADYLAMARAKDPRRVDALVRKMVPRAFWEVGVEDLSDPSWKLGDVSWPTDPAVWEAARRELAEIILGASTQSARPKAPANLVVK